MIEERLNQIFTNLEYRRIDSNAAGIYLFYRTEGMELTLVSLIHAVTGNELGKEQYEHILEQVKDNFRESNPHKIRLLSLILTASVDRVKHFCIENREDEHWIIDINTNRLIIYENQTNVFSEIRGQLEELLFEEARRSQADQEPVHNNVYSGATGSDSIPEQQDRIQPRYRLFTLMNTIIIVINILAFLLVHLTPFYGGESKMIAKGALSWYFVFTEKEYYRVLTSMFMHSDFSHIFNNMLVLIFVGDNLERAAGKLKYLFIYFGTGILAGITSISYNMWKENGLFIVGNSVFSIGASGAIFGVVGAMLFIVAINRGRLEDISTRQMVLFVVFSLYGGIANTQIDQAAHIGGFLAGILLAAIVYRRPKRRIGEQPV